MSRPAGGGGASDVTRFLSMEAGLGSPTSKSAFSAASQADWAAKRLVWVPSEKHGFEVRRTSLRVKQAELWRFNASQLFKTTSILSPYYLNSFPSGK